jgi:hypothetical protein
MKKKTQWWKISCDTVPLKNKFCVQEVCLGEEVKFKKEVATLKVSDWGVKDRILSLRRRWQL